MPIRTIFTDIGGVLLTNGWDHESRRIAAEKFELNAKETDDRHHLAFDVYETGRMTLDEYLEYTVFYQSRNFSKDDFKQFMYSCSRPYQEMIRLLITIKEKYKLKIGVVSNEGRELNNYRVKKFRLNEFVDFFVSSSYVHLKKPDKDIFKLALDLSQTSINEIVYIDDRALFVQVAESLGIKGVVHSQAKETREALEKLGLST